MILKSNVKVKSGLWNLTPWLNKFTANAIYPNIYLPKKVYENLCCQTPNLEYIGILIHEEMHIKREKQIGPIKFGLIYLISPKFRFNEELVATKEKYKFLKKHNIDPRIVKSAKALSGWLYLWPVSFAYAKKELEKAWEEA